MPLNPDLKLHLLDVPSWLPPTLAKEAKKWNSDADRLHDDRAKLEVDRTALMDNPLVFGSPARLIAECDRLRQVTLTAAFATLKVGRARADIEAKLNGARDARRREVRAELDARKEDVLRRVREVVDSQK